MIPRSNIRGIVFIVERSSIMNNNDNPTPINDSSLKYAAKILSHASIEDLVKIWIYSQNGEYDRYSEKELCEEMGPNAWRSSPGKGYEFHTTHGRFLIYDRPGTSLLSNLRNVHELFENHDIDKVYIHTAEHERNHFRPDGTLIL